MTVDLTSGQTPMQALRQRGVVCPEEWDTYRAFLLSGRETLAQAVHRLVRTYTSLDSGANAGQENLLICFLVLGSARAAARTCKIPESSGKAQVKRFREWLARFGLELAKQKTQRAQDRAKAEEARRSYRRSKDAAQTACSESCGRSKNKHKKIVKAWPKLKKPNGRYLYVPILDGRCPDCPMRAFEPDRGK